MKMYRAINRAYINAMMKTTKLKLIERYIEQLKSSGNYIDNIRADKVKESRNQFLLETYDMLQRLVGIYIARYLPHGICIDIEEVLYTMEDSVNENEVENNSEIGLGYWLYVKSLLRRTKSSENTSVSEKASAIYERMKLRYSDPQLNADRIRKALMVMIDDKNNKPTISIHDDWEYYVRREKVWKLNLLIEAIVTIVEIKENTRIKTDVIKSLTNQYDEKLCKNLAGIIEHQIRSTNKEEEYIKEIIEGIKNNQ